MQSFDLLEMWRNMAFLARVVNVLLAVCSMYSLWVIIDRAAVFRKVRKTTVDFIIGLRDQLKAKNVSAALTLAEKSDAPVAKVVYDALHEYKDGVEALESTGPDEIGDFDLVDAVNRVIDRTKEQQVSELKKGLGGLASISSAAPFIGLFGTVVGIINAFRAMAATGQGGLGAVSAGISEALFTTAVGLLVAIPAVMSFNYFTTVIERFIVEMNGVSSELLSYMLREGRDRK
jgi:biopolymer transport protein ExbB